MVVRKTKWMRSKSMSETTISSIGTPRKKDDANWGSNSCLAFRGEKGKLAKGNGQKKKEGMNKKAVGHTKTEKESTMTKKVLNFLPSEERG